MKTLKPFIIVLVFLFLFNGYSGNFFLNINQKDQYNEKSIENTAFTTDEQETVTVEVSDDESFNSEFKTNNPNQFINPKFGEVVYKLSKHKLAVTSLTFSKDGSKLISSSEDGTIVYWDLQTGKMIQQIIHFIGNEIKPIEFIKESPDGEILVSGSDKWNGTESYRKLNVWDNQKRILLKQLNDTVGPVTFTSDGRYLLSVGINDDYKCPGCYPFTEFILWDLSSWNKSLSFRSHFTTIPLFLDFTNNGEYFIAVFSNGIEFWNYLDYERIGYTELENGGDYNFGYLGQGILTTNIVFDNNLLFTSKSYTIKIGDAILDLAFNESIWNIETGQLVSEHAVKFEDLTQRIRYSPDNKLVAIKNSSYLAIREENSGRDLLYFKEQIDTFEFSQDGTMLALTKSNGDIFLYNLINYGSERRDFDPIDPGYNNKEIKLIANGSKAVVFQVNGNDRSKMRINLYKTLDFSLISSFDVSDISISYDLGNLFTIFMDRYIPIFTYDPIRDRTSFALLDIETGIESSFYFYNIFDRNDMYVRKLFLKDDILILLVQGTLGSTIYRYNTINITSMSVVADLTLYPPIRWHFFDNSDYFVIGNEDSEFPFNIEDNTADVRKVIDGSVVRTFSYTDIFPPFVETGSGSYSIPHPWPRYCIINNSFILGNNKLWKIDTGELVKEFLLSDNVWISSDSKFMITTQHLQNNTTNILLWNYLTEGLISNTSFNYFSNPDIIEFNIEYTPGTNLIIVSPYYGSGYFFDFDIPPTYGFDIVLYADTGKKVTNNIVFSHYLDESRNLLFLGTENSLEIWNLINKTLYNKIYLDFSYKEPLISEVGNEIVLETNNAIHESIKFSFYNLQDNTYIQDEDYDGLPYSWEMNGNLDPFNYYDKFDDNDGDGLLNYMEFFEKTNPMVNDTDIDMMTDGWEYLMGLNPNFNDSYLDADSDGIPNLVEFSLNFNARLNDKFIDNDGDGVSNYDEWISGTNPNQPETSTQTTTSADTSSTSNPDIPKTIEPNLLEILSIFLLFFAIFGISTFIMIKNKEKLKEPDLVKNSKLYKRTKKALRNFRHSLNHQPQNAILEISNESVLRQVYHKAIIGLENVRRDLLVSKDLLESLALDARSNYAIVGNIFPEDIRNDLKSGLRGRTVLILVEIAYQYPNNSYMVYLAKILDIPIQTVSREIKQLEKLNYIQQEITISNLNDNRYKYFKLTSRGILLLHLFKETLNITIMGMKKDEPIILETN